MLLQINEGNFFEERLDNISKAFKVAKELTQKSRALNIYRLKRKAHNKIISIGDPVMLWADDNITFASIWDPLVRSRRYSVKG